VKQVTACWTSQLTEGRLKGIASIQQRSTMAGLESERAERHAKACGLRRLRSYAQGLVPDDLAVFNEEIDCSAVFGVTASCWERGIHGLGRTKG
jgi:hypothetical protein